MENENGRCGYKNIENMLLEVGLTSNGEIEKNGKFLYASYTSKKPIHKVALQRKINLKLELHDSLELYNTKKCLM